MDFDNPAPKIYEETIQRERNIETDYDDSITDEIDEMEIYEHIRLIRDPEHPVTLESLKVVSPERIAVNRATNVVSVTFVPTISHCNLATLIGLSIRAKLMRALPHKYKLDITTEEGSHQAEEDVNKQLNDKERIAAAMENPNLLSSINSCIANTN